MRRSRYEVFTFYWQAGATMKKLLLRVAITLSLILSVALVGYSLNGLLNSKPAVTPNDTNVSQFDDSASNATPNKVTAGVVPVGQKVTDKGEVKDKGVETLMKCEDIASSSVFIPAHGIYTTVTNEGNFGTFDKDGGLVIPPTTDVATRWVDGANVTDKAGITIIAAHRSYNGYYSVFNKLPELKEGDIACASDSAGKIQKYQVESLKMYLKEDLPQDIFENPRVGKKELILVTCGGSIVQEKNGGLTYDQNLIARFRAID